MIREIIGTYDSGYTVKSDGQRDIVSDCLIFTPASDGSEFIGAGEESSDGDRMHLALRIGEKSIQGVWREHMPDGSVLMEGQVEFVPGDKDSLFGIWTMEGSEADESFGTWTLVKR